MEQKEFDVLIIGAGAAGLLAALEIALTGSKVAVLEAKDYCGGRILSYSTRNNYPAECGAEFVHGNLPVTLGLLKKAGLKKEEVRGSTWQKTSDGLHKQENAIDRFADFKKQVEKLDGDMPVAVFLSTYFNQQKDEELRSGVQQYVEGYYAGDIGKASTRALYKELTESDDENYRISGGYQPLLKYLESQCLELGVQFFLSHNVKEIVWKKGSVQALTTKASFTGVKILVTVSVGVLQKEGIRFCPALPQKKEAALHLGFGSVVKLNLSFTDAFWKDEAVTGKKGLGNMSFVFSEEDIPTWWSQHPADEPMLSGWLGGPNAEKIKHLTQEELTLKAYASLSAIFGVSTAYVTQKTAAVYFYNWSADVHFSGAYSYEVLNGEHYSKLLQQPVEETVFFCGRGFIYWRCYRYGGSRLSQRPRQCI